MWVLGMEFLNGLKLVHAYCIFLGKYVPSALLDQVLELVSEYAAIKDVFDFILRFSFNNDRTRRFDGLAREWVIADGLEKGNIENRVDVYRGWEVEFISVFPNFLDYWK
jgi:tryptophan synthase beta subunit